MFEPKISKQKKKIRNKFFISNIRKILKYKNIEEQNFEQIDISFDNKKRF